MITPRGTAGPTPARTPVPPAFVQDLNTCVGCHACVIACANENQLEAGRSWRQIVTVNPARRPQIPTFHLSVACNHCLDAPCLRWCPALAIARDPVTGAVLIDDTRCIGCRYCSWVCPYEAPRFDDARGVMRKCTLCAHRLAGGLEPACVSLCPTGALRLGAHRDEGDPDVAGFPRLGIRPAIRFLPLAGRQPVEQAVAPISPVAAATAAVLADEPPPKISLRSEWALSAFTLIAIALVSLVFGALLGGPRPPAWVVAAAGAGAMALSTLHLGRKDRARRAVLNWRRSWLSREVLTCPAFLGLAVAWLAWAPASGALGWAAAGAGLACLVSADRVYVVMARERRAALDGAAATSAAAWLAGVLAGHVWLWLPTGVARLVAALARVRAGTDRSWLGTAPAVTVRLAVGLAAPVFLLASGAATAPLAVLCATIGEALDRAGFYQALDVVTPRAAAARDLQASLAAGTPPRSGQALTAAPEPGARP